MSRWFCHRTLASALKVFKGADDGPGSITAIPLDHERLDWLRDNVEGLRAVHGAFNGGMIA